MAARFVPPWETSAPALRQRDNTGSLAPGTGIATPSAVSSHDLVVAATNELRGWRRGLDLLVLDQLRIEAWNRLLFIECGDGWIVEEAWRRALRGYACGLDVSSAHIQLAKRLREVPGKLAFQTWDGRRLPCPDQGFDRVVATFAVARAYDPADLLREMQRVARPDRDLYLLETDSIAGELRRILAAAGCGGVRQLSSPDTLLLVRAHAAPPA